MSVKEFILFKKIADEMMINLSTLYQGTLQMNMELSDVLTILETQFQDELKDDFEYLQLTQIKCTSNSS